MARAGKDVNDRTYARTLAERRAQRPARSWPDLTVTQMRNRLSPQLEGAVKNRGQPHGPRCRETTRKSKSSPSVRGNDARWYTVPTPSHARPQAVSVARWVEPRCATRSQKRKFSQWKLDGRGHRGANVAAVSRTDLCQERDNRMTHTPNNVAYSSGWPAPPSAGPCQAMAGGCLCGTDTSA